MFKRVEIVKQLYEGGISSETTIGVDSNCDSHSSKRKVREAISPTNPKKVFAGDRKGKHAGHPSDRMIGERTCLFNGLRNS